MCRRHFKSAPPCFQHGQGVLNFCPWPRTGTNAVSPLPRLATHTPPTQTLVGPCRPFLSLFTPEISTWAPPLALWLPLACLLPASCCPKSSKISVQLR